MDYNQFVLKWFSQLDAALAESQEDLRTYIAASCSFLVLDSANKKSPEDGLSPWVLGMNRIMDMITSIHNPLLEYETVEGLSRALSECWTASHTLDTSGEQYIQENITAITGRLRRLLDPTDSTTPTFKNQPISLNFV
jgi:hypothetical protein